MKLSVIIPVFNSEKYVNNLLNSILKQTYKNYEVIIVNDGSTDNTKIIIEKYCQKDNRIKIFDIKNSGPGYARKIGFEKSTGDLLFFVDSDDYIYDENVFDLIIKKYEKNKFEILFFNANLIFKDGEKVRNGFYKNIEIGRHSVGVLKKYGCCPALWYKIFVKEKMKIEFFSDYSNYEDLYTTYMYLNECDTFDYTNDVFYCSLRNNPESISKKISFKKVSMTVELFNSIYNLVDFKEIISYHIFKYYFNMRKLLIKNKSLSKTEKNNMKNELKKLEKYLSYINFNNIGFKNKIILIIVKIIIFTERRIKK